MEMDMIMGPYVPQVNNYQPWEFLLSGLPFLLWRNAKWVLLGKCRTSHTKEAHKRLLRSISLVSRLAGREKMAQQLLSLGLALSSVWEKARARDRQREVVGDKGHWVLICQGWDKLWEQGLGEAKGGGGRKGTVGFDLQGMSPAAKARSRGR
jgi:hypothetical protein